MATVAVNKTINAGGDKIVLAQITMDSSYLTGGEVVIASDFGLTGINAIFCGSPPLGGFLATYDNIAGTVKLFVSTTGTPNVLIEHASTVTAATAVVPLLVFGY